MKIDWTEFNEFPENTCHCRCGSIYRSHTKLVMEDGEFIQVSEKPCPACNKTEGHLWRVSSDPEQWNLRS